MVCQERWMRWCVFFPFLSLVSLELQLISFTLSKPLARPEQVVALLSCLFPHSPSCVLARTCAAASGRKAGRCTHKASHCCAATAGSADFWSWCLDASTHSQRSMATVVKWMEKALCVAPSCPQVSENEASSPQRASGEREPSLLQQPGHWGVQRWLLLDRGNPHRPGSVKEREGAPA